MTTVNLSYSQLITCEQMTFETRVNIKSQSSLPQEVDELQLNSTQVKLKHTQQFNCLNSTRRQHASYTDNKVLQLTADCVSNKRTGVCYVVA